MTDRAPWDVTDDLYAPATTRSLLRKPYDLEYYTPAGKQRNWEHRIVGKLLKHYRMLDQVNMLKSVMQAETGIARLSFSVFFECNQSFPIWLTARKIPHVHRTSIGDFLHRFGSTRLYSAYGHAEADTPREFRYSGLVFEWLHVWPFAIIHNYPVEATDATFVCKYINGQFLAVQSFQSFLTGLNWSRSSGSFPR